MRPRDVIGGKNITACFRVKIVYYLSKSAGHGDGETETGVKNQSYDECSCFYCCLSCSIERSCVPSGRINWLTP